MGVIVCLFAYNSLVYRGHYFIQHYCLNLINPPPPILQRDDKEN